jgi:hypothetical protein
VHDPDRAPIANVVVGNAIRPMGNRDADVTKVDSEFAVIIAG